jgi:demethylmenaquinone methyltransferase/2-methoxy-6-polyprenyl-1,4-benzoquinol methylase
MNSRDRSGRSNYDRLSPWYDLLAGPSERACRALGLRMLQVQPGERVLEIGAGTGQALGVLSRSAGPAGCAWGIDLSMGMCRVAGRRRAAAEGSWLVIRGDALRLPARDAAFDAVFMSFALELFEATDMERVLGECARALRPGGRLAVVALADDGRPGIMQRAYVWAHRRFPGWVDCRPIPVPAILAASGLRVRSTVRTAMWGLPVQSVRAYKASWGRASPG